MCDDIMREVSGCHLSSVRGTLKDFQRRAVKGEHYPALVSHPGGRVDGVVYRDVPPSAWERLDRFEGEMYVRQAVEIELNEGGAVSAVTYVARPEFHQHLERRDWDFSEFLRQGKTSFRSHYKGYRAL